jgi:hypothetical protein
VTIIRVLLVDFDFEVRASTALLAPLLPERSSKVCRLLLELRSMQSKLGILDLDDD